MRKFRQLLALVDKLSWGAAQVAVAALIAMTLLITFEVIVRKSFDISTKIAHDFSGYLLVVLTFFGAAITLKAGRHLRVTVLFARLNQRIQSILYKIYLIIGISFVLVLLWASSEFVMNAYTKGWLTESVIAIPEFIPEAFIPLGLLFFVLQLVAQLCKRIQ